MNKQHIKPFIEIEDKKTGERYLVTKVNKEKDCFYALNKSLTFVTLGLGWARDYGVTGIWHMDDLLKYIDCKKLLKEYNKNAKKL